MGHASCKLIGGDEGEEGELGVVEVERDIERGERGGEAEHMLWIWL